MEITKPKAAPPADANPWQDWIDAECKRREEEENPDRKTTLLPLDRFPTTTGHQEIDTRLGDDCPRYRVLESAPASRPHRFYGFRHRRDPLPAVALASDQRSHGPCRVLSEYRADVRVSEPAAETTGEYSLQDVAWWIRELEIPCYERIRFLNAMADPGIGDATRWKTSMTDNAKGVSCGDRSSPEEQLRAQGFETFVDSDDGGGVNGNLNWCPGN